MPPPSFTVQCIQTTHDAFADHARTSRFILVLSATDADDLHAAVAALPQALDEDCVEVCCVGLLSAKLEDEIDFVVESRDALSMVATAFTDPVEAAEYLATAARLNDASVLLFSPPSSTGAQLLRSIELAISETAP